MKYIPHFWIELRYRIQSLVFTPVEYFADPFFLSTFFVSQNWNSKKFSFFSLSFFLSLYLVFSIRPFPRDPFSFQNVFRSEFVRVPSALAESTTPDSLRTYKATPLFENVELKFKPNWKDRLQTTNLPFFLSFPNQADGLKPLEHNTTKIFRFLNSYEFNTIPISSFHARKSLSPGTLAQLSGVTGFHPTLEELSTNVEELCASAQELSSIAAMENTTNVEDLSAAKAFILNSKLFKQIFPEYNFYKSPLLRTERSDEHSVVVHGVLPHIEFLRQVRTELLALQTRTGTLPQSQRSAGTLHVFGQSRGKPAAMEERGGTAEMTKKYIGYHVYKPPSFASENTKPNVDPPFFSHFFEGNKKKFDYIEEENIFEKPSELHWENFKKISQRFSTGTLRGETPTSAWNARTKREKIAWEKTMGKLFSLKQEKDKKSDFDTLKFFGTTDFLLGQEGMEERVGTLRQNKFKKKNQKLIKDSFFIPSKPFPPSTFVESSSLRALPRRTQHLPWFHPGEFVQYDDRHVRPPFPALPRGPEGLAFLREINGPLLQAFSRHTKPSSTILAFNKRTLLNFFDSLSFHIVSVDPGAFTRSFVSLRAPFSLIGSFFLFSLSFSFFKIRSFFDSLIQNSKNQDGTVPGNGTNVDLQIIFPTQLIPTLADFRHVGLNMSFVQKTFRSFQIYSSQIFFIRIIGFCCFQYYAFSQQQLFLWSSFFFGILSYDFNSFKNLFQKFCSVPLGGWGETPRLRSTSRRSQDLPKAFLLSGLSGTGKSYFFQALTRETKCLGIRASLHSALTAILESKFFQPCIIFLDHIDSVGKKREVAWTTTPGSSPPQHSLCSPSQRWRRVPAPKRKVPQRSLRVPQRSLRVQEDELFTNVEGFVLESINVTAVDYSTISLQKNKEKKKKQSSTFVESSSTWAESSLPPQSNNTLLSLLVYLDGSVRNSDSNILLGSTFCADNLDRALLRPGRFDMILHFSYPEKNDRIQILKLQAAVQPWTVVSPLVSWNFLSTLTRSFSPADLNLLLQKSEKLNVLTPMRYSPQTWRVHTMFSLMRNLCFFVERKSFSSTFVESSF